MTEDRRRARREEVIFPVRFGDVSIRMYPPILGDNPGGVYGPPLSIDWEHQSENWMTVDQFENTRSGERKNLFLHRSRSEFQLLLTRGERYRRLKRCYSPAQINAAERSVEAAREKRWRAVKTPWFLRWKTERSDEMLESLKWNIKNVLSMGKLKREERELLRPYLKAKKMKESMAKFAKDASNSVSSKRTNETTETVVFFCDEENGNNTAHEWTRSPHKANAYGICNLCSGKGHTLYDCPAPPPGPPGSKFKEIQDLFLTE